MSQATRDCGTSARQANEADAYKEAVTAKNPADRHQVAGSSFSRITRKPSTPDDIEIVVFLAYREQGDAAKALAAAEKLVAHNDTREDAMLLVAESYFKSGKDPNAVVSLSKKAIDRLNKAEKPEGISDADWARNKTTELTQANYMIGSVNFQAEKWEAADQAFRAALPNLTDPRFRAEVLNSLGWANYKLKNVADAIKFYIDCTNIPGPFQLAAAKTLNTITAEYRIKIDRPQGAAGLDDLLATFGILEPPCACAHSCWLSQRCLAAAGACCTRRSRSRNTTPSKDTRSPTFRRTTTFRTSGPARV